MGEFTELVTGESAEPTGSVDLADLEESAWLTRSVGLADWAVVERELAEPMGQSAEPTSLYLHGKN